MTPRHIALAVGSAAVLALGLYLFFAVRSAPAQPSPTPRAAANPPPDHVVATAEPEAKAPAPVPPPAPPPTPPTRPATNIPHGEPDLREPAPPPSRTLIQPFRSPKGMAESNPKFDAVMAEANSAYDRGDFDEARQKANAVLAKMPGNARMLRILVSASCIEGDNAEAQKFYNQLPPSDRAAMKTRCDRYGVTFTDPPAQ